MLLAAEIISELEMEGALIITALEVVVEMVKVTDSWEVEVTETVVGGSVDAAVPLEVSISGVLALSSRIEGLLLSSVTSVGVVAATGPLTASMHVSASEGGTVLEGEIVKLVESVTESEIVGTVAVVVVAMMSGVAGVDVAGLVLVGVFVSASCIWASSFSGVLRPEVVRGGPGLMTGFGSKAGFPADSCADTLERI